MQPEAITCNSLDVSLQIALRQKRGKLPFCDLIVERKARTEKVQNQFLIRKLSLAMSVFELIFPANWADNTKNALKFRSVLAFIQRRSRLQGTCTLCEK
jgi:hypothetical protein